MSVVVSGPRDVLSNSDGRSKVRKGADPLDGTRKSSSLQRQDGVCMLEKCQILTCGGRADGGILDWGHRPGVCRTDASNLAPSATRGPGTISLVRQRIDSISAGEG